MNISRSQIFAKIKSITGNACYLGLHGVADVSDLQNEFSSLSKEQKAKNMLKIGIINKRGESMFHIVRNFGRIDIMPEEYINGFNGINRYGFYSPSGKECIAVVGVPLFFEDSKGRKIYGGYKTSRNPKSTQAECLTDYLFRNNIPPEMIVGYYTYDEGSEIANFVENPRYYTKLSQEEKDSFIEEHFINSLFVYDVNSEEERKRFETYSKIIQTPYLVNTINQYTSGIDIELSSKKMKQMMIEYEDGVHYVNCYRFAKSILPDGKTVFFMEYKDYGLKKETDAFSENALDSYAILELDNNNFFKSKKEIPYDILKENVIEELDIDILPDYLTFNDKNIEQKRETSLETEQSYYANPIYVALNIDDEENGFIYSDKIVPILFQAIKHDSYDDSEYSMIFIELKDENIPHIINHINSFRRDGKIDIHSVKDFDLGIKKYKFISSSKEFHDMMKNIDKDMVPVIKFDAPDYYKEKLEKESLEAFTNGLVFGKIELDDSNYLEVSPLLRTFEVSKILELQKANNELQRQINIKFDFNLSHLIDYKFKMPKDFFEFEELKALLSERNSNLQLQLKMSHNEYESQNDLSHLISFINFFEELGIEDFSPIIDIAKKKYGDNIDEETVKTIKRNRYK